MGALQAPGPEATVLQALGPDDFLHIDVMDGRFVPNVGWGAPIVKDLRQLLGEAGEAGEAPTLDCHLMVTEPSRYVEDMAAAGADVFSFHIETLMATEASAYGGRVEATETLGADALVRRIRDAGMRVGVAIKPKTTLESELVRACGCRNDTVGGAPSCKTRAAHLSARSLPPLPASRPPRRAPLSPPRTQAVLAQCDMAVVMTVEPGFGGQRFMPEVMPKVRELRRLFPQLDIQVDGGVTPDTIEVAAEAGANVVVAGSAVFGADDPAATIAELWGRMQRHF